MKILGIETSCDETAVAVVEDGQRLLSNAVASSVDLHVQYGGVVPEIAARSHLEVIIPVIEEALSVANCTWDDIDAIAVTYGAGLSGSLLIGALTARTLAIAKKKPLYAINHVRAHVYANFITETSLPNYSLPKNAPQFPFLALIVSGGHSQLVLFESHQQYKLLGQALDDAVGEAFDKVAKLLGLPYPGGPSISTAALGGDPNSIPLPQAKLSSKYDFSFSGLKTAVLRAAQKQCAKGYDFPSYQLSALLSEAQKADLAASFQQAAITALVRATKNAEASLSPKNIVVAGGVAANQELRKQLSENLNTPLEYSDIKLCTDNGAMIAACAYYLSQAGLSPADPYTLEVDPSLSM